MKKTDSYARRDFQMSAKEDKEVLLGYPNYPVTDDIYNKHHEEKNINPEDITQLKYPVTGVTQGSDLDIPGAELDDEQEDIGNEDEENNYYSIGGDDHDNLEEDQGN